MSNIFDYSVDELEEISEKLQMAIEELEDIIEVEEQNIEDSRVYITSQSTTPLIIAQHQKNIDNTDKLVDFLEEIKDVIDEFISEMEDNVKPNSDKVKIDPEEIGDAVKKIEEHVEDGNFYNGIVKEGNLFDIWELNAKTDLLHLTEKDKKEQEEFDYCRYKLDDLNDKLHKLYRQIEESTDDLTTKYRLIFEDLEGGEWIKGLVEDLEMEEFDFSEFLSIGLINSAITRANEPTTKDNIQDINANIEDIMSNIDTGNKSVDTAIKMFIRWLYDNDMSISDINDLIGKIKDLPGYKILDSLGNVSEVYDYFMLFIAGFIFEIDRETDGEIGYESTKNLAMELSGWIGGEIGEKIGRAIATFATAYIGGAGAPLGKALGDIIGTAVAQHGVEYVFDCLFSEGVDGDLVLDAELELFFYKIETGEMDSVEEIIENFNDIFI